MKTRKRRRKVEPGMSDPLSERITALQMKVIELQVDIRRTRNALQTLICRRTVQGIWREAVREAIPERKSE